jgi:hypothetical protein
MTNSKMVSQLVSTMAKTMNIETLRTELGKSLKNEFAFDTLVEWDGESKASIFVKEDSEGESIVMNVLDVNFE